MRYKQEGKSTIGLLIIVASLAAVTMLIFKVGPVYLEDSYIAKVVKSFDGKNDMRGRSREDVLRVLNKRLNVNNVHNLSKSAISLTERSGNYILVIEYEPRGNIFYTLDYIISFYHEAVFPAQ